MKSNTELLKSLEINQSISIDSPRYEVEPILEDLDGFFDIIYSDKAMCVVLRMAHEKKSIAQRVVDEINSLTIFQEKEVQGNLGYIRSIVSAFNKENDRSVKVIKRKNAIFITEDFMNRESITLDEFRALEVRLSEIHNIFTQRCTGDLSIKEVDNSDELI